MTVISLDCEEDVDFLLSYYQKSDTEWYSAMCNTLQHYAGKGAPSWNNIEWYLSKRLTFLNLLNKQND